MNRQVLVVLFVIFSLLFILLVMNSISFRRLENESVNYWLNLISAVVVLILILVIIYQIAKNTNVTLVQH